MSGTSQQHIWSAVWFFSVFFNLNQYLDISWVHVTVHVSWSSCRFAVLLWRIRVYWWLLMRQICFLYLVPHPPEFLLGKKSSVMVNVHCQLAWIKNYLGNQWDTFCIYLWGHFQRKLTKGRNMNSEYGWHHSMGWGPKQEKREKDTVSWSIKMWRVPATVVVI